MDMLRPFFLEREFAKYEFAVEHLLSPSDCETLSLKSLLLFADAEMRDLWDNLKLGYTESQGHPLLREEITKLYRTISPGHILGVVPEEGIFITMMMLLKPTDHVIVACPGYQPLYEVARAQGCEITPWYPQENTGWKFDLDVLESLLREATKLIVVNFPHNPTGALMSRKEFERLMDIARQRDIIIFSDEMYRFLEYNDHDRLEGACDIYENAISLGGMSKAFSLPGLRIGWLATKNRAILDTLAHAKDYTTICASAPSEILATIALRVKEFIIERNLTIIRRNLALFRNFVEMKHPDIFSLAVPQAGSVAFPRFLPDIPITELCEDLVKEKGVMLLSGGVYEYPGNHFRVGLGRKNFPQALAVFDEYVRELG